MADVQPFRAVRYSGAAGRLADLVAPPYDAVSAEERARLYDRSPYNVLHLTLPASVEAARDLYRGWLEQGVLEREDESSAWLAVERFVGPDVIERERRGLIVSLAAEPYGTDGVLPHERTDPEVREERLRLLRATGVQPEPIFVLTGGELDLRIPERPAEVEVDGTRLWRLEDVNADDLAPEPLLVADGHHRYESAVALGPELADGARIMALVVSAADPGLHVFPTHRVFWGRPDLAAAGEGEAHATLEEALERLAAEPFTRAAAVAVRPTGAELVLGREGQLDADLVDAHGLRAITYTPSLSEAVEAVERGGASVAYLLREPRVDDLFAVARRGERMPPKSTYFFPKPLSGLLFHPVGP
jgi:uncharacterized protein (DUF1015 family)